MATRSHCSTATINNTRSASEAVLSYTFAYQYWASYPGPADPLQRALQAARRALELDPTSQLAHFALANVYFFLNELETFYVEAEKALELNPNNTEILAGLAVRYSNAGNTEHGIALMEKARALNPSHPGWYWYPLSNFYYKKGDYRAALDVLRRVNMPQSRVWHSNLASCYGHLGQHERAKSAWEEALKLSVPFNDNPLALWRRWFRQEADLQIRVDGLRKVGLEILDQEG